LVFAELDAAGAGGGLGGLVLIMVTPLLVDGVVIGTGDSGAWPGYCTITRSLLSILVTSNAISAA
jgi:hypothetical protein